MERFEHLFSKNETENGGSFYLQSKVYFAKEFLMQDHPPELNVSKYNPSEEQVDDDEGDVDEQTEKSGEDTEEPKDEKSESDKSK